MKILMIVTYFPPDTAVAAVRPFMFAKYLASKGHEITVLRSGEILASIDGTYDFEKYGIRVISYLGEDSAAERYRHGLTEESTVLARKSRISFIPVKLRKHIAKLYHKLMKPLEYSREMQQTNMYFERQKKTIDSIKDEKFDIVWSTYGRLENILAGRYAKETFRCPWILDLRDWIATEQNSFVRTKQRRFEKEYVNAADACVVVMGSYCEELKQLYPDANVVTIHNGYDNYEKLELDSTDGKLHFCYTGSLYTGKLDVSPLFKALARLVKEGRIDKNRIVFTYAGTEFEYLLNQAKKYGMESILENMGYMNRKRVNELQQSSDIFVVAARSTKFCNGELTGKFYEGIRAKKPILTVISGDVANCELKQMQDRYNYGYCFEQANGRSAEIAFDSYLLQIYQEKMNAEAIEYHPDESLFTDFRYDTLTDKLLELMSSVIHSEFSS